MHSKVNFIGVGVQKSGTTWLHRILDEHPEICVARGKDKDTMFFGAYYDRGYEWYEQHFADCESGKLAGEVSTSYFYNTDAPERVHLYNSDIRLFVCLRNPVDRIISNHKHEARLGHISGDNLDLSIALKNNPAYKMQSCYAKHLKKWHQYFPKERMKVILFDDIINRPEYLASELYRYLGVDDGFMPDLGKKENVSRVPASRLAEGVIRKTGKIIRVLGLGKLVDMGRKAGFNDWLRSRNAVSDADEVLSIRPETIAQLNKELYPEIMELSELTGIDLTSWSSD